MSHTNPGMGVCAACDGSGLFGPGQCTRCAGSGREPTRRDTPIPPRRKLATASENLREARRDLKIAMRSMKKRGESGGDLYRRLQHAYALLGHAGVDLGLYERNRETSLS